MLVFSMLAIVFRSEKLSSGLYVNMQKGHGIPSSLLKEVRELSHQFFELPLEEKLKIKLSPATGYRLVSITLN